MSGNGKRTGQSVAALLAQQDGAKPIYRALRSAIAELGRCKTRVSKSQIAFTRDKAFALVWIPRQYLRGEHAPLVLTLLAHTAIRSARWKEVVQASPGHFTHHLELYRPQDVDREVKRLLRLAWDGAGE